MKTTAESILYTFFVFLYYKTQANHDTLINHTNIFILVNRNMRRFMFFWFEQTYF